MDISDNIVYNIHKEKKLMNQDKRKLVLVGTGFVGMSMAYTFLNTKVIDELVLIDMDENKSIGEAMDLNHGIPYASSNLKIRSGSYEECRDADVVVITAGAAQKSGQTRLELTMINAKIMKSITENIMKNGFNGILVVASNPVDLMSYVAWKVSGLPSNQVIGSGTILDTARLRYLMSEYLHISANNVHAYMMGEHGDSSFVPWTSAYIGCKSLLDLLDEKHKDLADLHEIYEQVRNAAYEIIDKKKATYYGIGLALNRLVSAILEDENVILTVSALQQNEYGREGLYIGVPAIINRQGISEIMKIPLTEVDQNKFNQSCDTLLPMIKEINHELNYE